MSLIRALLDRFVPRGALTLAFLSLAYFAAGIVRNRVLSNAFGAGPELDAYNAAFRIPEIALDILVASGLTAPFVPIFIRLEEDPDGRRAERFARTVLTAAILVMSIALGLLLIAAPLLADTAFAAFDPPTRALYVELFRINCLAQVLFAASICLGEVLVARRRFFWYALAPVLYTTGIVVGTIVLGPSMGIHGTAIGALAGAGAHLATRTIGVLRAGFRPGAALAIRTDEFREFVRLMVPRMISYPIDPLIGLSITLLATQIGPGTASALAFVLDYQFVPVQLIGITFSLAVFPLLSEAFAEGDGTRFRALLRRNVVTIAALTSLAAVALALGSTFGVRLIHSGGRFTEGDVALTAGLLTLFAVSVPIDALSYPLSRAMYATHNTVFQVIASVAGLATLLVVAQLAKEPLGIGAIPLAYASGGLVKLVVLAAFLIPRVRRIGAGDVATPRE